MHHLTPEEQEQAREHNKHIRANSGNNRNGSKDRASLRELAEKGKDLVFGRK
jgi:hypothetical protein